MFISLVQITLVGRTRKKRQSGVCIPQIQPVVNVVPQSSAAQHIALSFALLTSEPIRTLAVLAWITIEIRVEV